jgi:hypothetical protein
MQGGISFKVALDPRVRVTAPPMKVRIDNSSIVAMKRQLGEFPSMLDDSGIYNVGRVRHVGDSRGNDWYTEIDGFTSPGKKATMLSGNTANANPNMP